MYHISMILKEHGISLNSIRNLMQFKISKTSLHDIVANCRWPRRADSDALKQEITSACISAGVHSKNLRNAWRTVKANSPKPTAPAKTKSPDEIILRRKTMIGPEIQKQLGLLRDPFDGELESSEDVMATKPHQRVLNKMIEAAKSAKFLAVVGPVGSGKSVMKTLFLEELKRKQNYLISEPEIISKEKCLPSNIISAMVDDFLYFGNRTRSFKTINFQKGDLEVRSRWVHALLKLKISEGKKLVLLIDEAHGLREETLRSLKRFHELQEGFRKLLSIILVGQDELLETLAGNYALREVSARVSIIEMKPIPGLIEDYVSHKLTRAGATDAKKIFDDGAMKTVKRLLPKAVPLAVNNLISRSIEVAYDSGQFPITGEIVERAYRSFQVLAA